MSQCWDDLPLFVMFDFCLNYIETVFLLHWYKSQIFPFNLMCETLVDFPFSQHKMSVSQWHVMWALLSGLFLVSLHHIVNNISFLTFFSRHLEEACFFVFVFVCFYKSCSSQISAFNSTKINNLFFIIYCMKTYQEKKTQLFLTCCCCGCDDLLLN